MIGNATTFIEFFVNLWKVYKNEALFLSTKYGVKAYGKYFPDKVADEKLKAIGFYTDADGGKAHFASKATCSIQMILAG